MVYYYCLDDKYSKYLIKKGMKLVSNKKIEFAGMKCWMLVGGNFNFDKFEIDKIKCIKSNMMYF